MTKTIVLDLTDWSNLRAILNKHSAYCERRRQKTEHLGLHDISAFWKNWRDNTDQLRATLAAEPAATPSPPYDQAA